MSDCGCDSGGGDYGGGDSGGCDYGGGDSGGCDYGGGDSGGCDYGGGDSGGCDYGGGNDSPCCDETQSATSNRNSFSAPVDVFLDDTYNTTIQEDTYVPVHTYTKYTTHRTYNTRSRNRTNYYTSSSGGCDGDDQTNNIFVGIVSVFLIFLLMIALVQYNARR